MRTGNGHQIAGVNKCRNDFGRALHIQCERVAFPAQQIGWHGYFIGARQDIDETVFSIFQHWLHRLAIAFAIDI